MELMASEKELCAEVGIAEEAALLLKEATGRMVEPVLINGANELCSLQALCSVGEPTLLDGLRISVPADYHAYHGQRWYDFGGRGETELILTLDLDPLFVVRYYVTNGTNYGVSHEDIVARLEKWKELFGIDVRGASLDFVELRFENLPADLMNLVEEIYWFCSDVTDLEGDESDQEREPELFARAQELPEPSPQFFERLNREATEVMGEGWELESAPGLRLLAAQLERDHRLYLWWD